MNFRKMARYFPALIMTIIGVIYIKIQLDTPFSVGLAVLVVVFIDIVSIWVRELKDRIKEAKV